jgi:hypothetical protein
MMEVRSWKLEVGRLEVGGWRLEVGGSLQDRKDTASSNAKINYKKIPIF